MANARMISREFFTSADLQDQPYWASVLFAGMIVFADDAGVIRADPMYLRCIILAPNMHRRCPKSADIVQVLNTYIARRMLTACNFEGVSCYKITNFTRFQRLKRREGKRREDDEAIARDDVATSPILTQEICELGDLFEAYAFEFKLGRPKGADTLKRHKPDMADVEAWRAIRPSLHEKTFRWAVQQFKSPKDLLAYRARLDAEDRKDVSLKDSPEDRREAVIRLRSKEILAEIATASTKACEPPAEFFAAYRKLRQSARATDDPQEANNHSNGDQCATS